MELGGCRGLDGEGGPGGEAEALRHSRARSLFALGPSSQHGAGTEPIGGRLCAARRGEQTPVSLTWQCWCWGGRRRCYPRPRLSDGQNTATPSGSAWPWHCIACTAAAGLPRV